MSTAAEQIKQQAFHLFLFYFNLPDQCIRDPKRWKCTVKAVPHKSQPFLWLPEAKECPVKESVITFPATKYIPAADVESFCPVAKVY